MLVDRIQVTEKVLLDGDTTLKLTRDGYLVATPRVARTGIQIYGGSEVGKPAMDRVRVWRPEDEVFNVDALASLAYRPITNDHPTEPVTADNWRKLAVGQVGGDVARDGDYIRVPLAVMDSGTIQDIKDGKKEISLGYEASLEWRSGVNDRGEAYDAVQTGIRVNHLAIVDAARGGSKLSIGDAPKKKGEQDPPARREDTSTSANNEEQQNMTTQNDSLKRIIVDGVAVSMTEISADIVQRALDGAAKELGIKTTALDAANKVAEELRTKVTALETDHAKVLAAKDAEIVTLTQKVKDSEITPTKLDALVKDRAVVIAKAKAVLGDKLVVDGKSLADIRKQVVTEKMGDLAKNYSDDLVTVSFDTLTQGVEIKNDETGSTNDAAARIAAGFSAAGSAPGQVTRDARDKALEAHEKRLQDAWKNPGGAAVQ
jgi:hypothetical protein